MQHFTLNGTSRKVGNKAVIKEFRSKGLVPCNIYGCGVENLLFTVDAKELKNLTDTPASYIVDLVIDGDKKFTAILHELQWHPVSDICLHVDFLAVNEQKPIYINVPLEVSGHSVGVQKGGKFYQSAREIRISALMANLPDKVTVDISALDLDKKIRAAEIKVDNATVVTDKDTIICGVKSTRNSSAA